MQSCVWVALLRHIPAEQHDQYVLVTSGGNEIAVQGLLRIEMEFVVVKGRLAGSQDAGRVFFVPYSQIDYFGTFKPVKDSDFNDVFGSLVIPNGAMPEDEHEAHHAELPPAPPNGSGRGSGPRPAIRSEVLERYRSRPASSTMLPNPKANGS
jgi:hypothetical protein